MIALASELPNLLNLLPDGRLYITNLRDQLYVEYGAAELNLRYPLCRRRSLAKGPKFPLSFSFEFKFKA